jgi:hypothetical protein
MPSEPSDRVAHAIADALTRPLTGEIWPGLTDAVFERFGEDARLMDTFVEKSLQTLTDFERHDRLMFSGSEPRVGLWFVAWSGTHREVQPERYGEYLPALLSTAYRFVQAGVPLAGFLEIDVYLRGDARNVEVDAELSFLPGTLLGCADEQSSLPPVMQVNNELCTPEEVQQLRRVAG